MGALHDGHLTLIRQAKAETDFVICSIFINPTQFNDPADFLKYPVTVENDIRLLISSGCDMLFLPSKEDLYPQGEHADHFDLGEIETLLEGAYRPGHFQGVAHIVSLLLDIIEPNKLYVGEKDFQQCLVIQKLLDQQKRNIELRIVQTVREKDGLAMSSRNMRLNAEARKNATAIYNALNEMKRNAFQSTPDKLIASATSMLEAHGFRTDYIAIVDAITLNKIKEWNHNNKPVALIAAFIGDVRLIDNMRLG